MTDQDYFIIQIEDHKKLTLLQAVKIINYRMKHKIVIT